MLTREKFEAYNLVQRSKSVTLKRELTDKEIIECAKSMFKTYLNEKDLKGIRKNLQAFHYLEIFEKEIFKYINR
jgi:hypothetical protein